MIVYIGVLYEMDISDNVFSGVSVSEVFGFNIIIFMIVLYFLG